MHPSDEFTRIMAAIEELSNRVADMNKHRFAEQYITNEELLQLLSISRRTAQDWRDQGILPYAQFAKKIFYRLSDIERMFNEEFSRKKPPAKLKEPSPRKALRKPRKGNGWDIRL